MRRCSASGGQHWPGKCCDATLTIVRAWQAAVRKPNPSLAGGSTFAADPALDCACSDYMWTAAADPHVLLARVLPRPGQDGAIDLTGVRCCDWRHDGRCHSRIDLPDGAMRLDLIEGEIASGGLRIEPALDFFRPLDAQIASIRRLHALCHGRTSTVRDQRFVRLVEALRVGDALAAGASLRDIGLGALGDDWPGDGEHVKSRARRRVMLAASLARAGPRGVLSGQI